MHPTTMTAAVCRRYGEPLVLERLPWPRPGTGEAVLRVDAVGICATDLKTIGGALRPQTTLPLIPGHEVAGTVVHSPHDPSWEGRRVACYLYEHCGACRWCRAGRPTLCPRARRIGIERDGGLATHMVAALENLLPFGEGIDPAAAAIAMDAVTTPWGALRRRARVRSGERVVVAGCGGLGLNAVQIARSAGAAVAAIDPNPRHRALAVERGAEVAVAPDELDELRAWAPDGADVVLEASGRRGGFDAAVAAVRPGGRIVCNGYQPGLEYGLDSARLVLAEITVIGSRMATREDACAALAAVEAGEIAPVIMRRMPLDAVNAALDALAAGEVDGRIVITPGEGA